MLGPVELVAEVDSTNRVLLDRARGGEPAGTVLVADFQTAGRGRLGRSWEARPGAALLVSVLLRPDLPPASAHRCTFAAGLAAVEACGEVAGVEAGLKWPNDVLVGDRKLAGLLAEAVLDGDRLAAVVVGMGLNLAADGVPEGGISLEEAAGRPVDRQAVLDAWLARFDARLADLDGILDDYRAASATLGRTVRVQLPGATFEGEAADVTADGHLVVATPSGERTVAAGDVVHLRPA